MATAATIALIGGTALAAGLCLRPKVLRSRSWRATVTPLASIIGSGFLVVGPILADTAGSWAWLAMVALCSIGYLYGAAIRQNILFIQPHLHELPAGAAQIEQLSDLALALSYFISVAYYLNLFAAFGLRIAGIEDPGAIRIVATVAIAIIGAIGFRGGLAALERLEVGAVGIKLSVIGGLLASLAVAYGLAITHHSTLSAPGNKSPLQALQIILGLVILVQGFETSRYLGEKYDAATRQRTMRRAQWISSAIYLLFVFMLTHLFRDDLKPIGGETQIIDMLRPLSAAAAPLLIIAALASQSSAAIADMNGAGGLLKEATGKRIPVALGNLATAMVAIAITWSADIFEIITYASKAFVGYYGLQSFQAARSSWDHRSYGRTVLFAGGVVLAVCIIIFAVPADA
ncbi:MAG: hypothetical protein ABI626_09840 [Sphingomicrobium sp.]